MKLASESKKINILIVDDWPQNLATLKALLKGDDYNIVQAASGAEALSAMCPPGEPPREFAVVLLDVMMPEMNGFDCAAAIRKCPNCACTPIIFVSAVADDLAFVFKGYQAGAVDYIVKPLEPAIVKAKVAIFADLFRIRQALKRELAESRALCQRLRQKMSDEQADQEALVAQVKDYSDGFEERCRHIQCL